MRTLAETATGAQRKRLLVLAHVLELAERELEGSSGRRQSAPELVPAIRSGRHDQELLDLVGQFREGVRAQLTVANPGYDRPPHD